MKNAKRLLLSLFSTRRFGAAWMRATLILFAALLGLFAKPSIAEVYDPYTGPDPVAPSLRLMAEPFAAAEALGPVSVSIRSLNAQTFPFVFLDVDATDETGTCPLFSAESFQVLEDGVVQTDYFAVTPPNENQGVRLVDVVFIMDNSGSMSDDQLAVRNNVYGFVDKLTQAGINFAFGLTRYGQGASSGGPLVQDNGNLTSDAAYFKDTVWTRNSIDGGTEPGYWSMVESATKFNFRPGSRRVFIIITDENPNQGGATLDQAAAALQSGDVTLFAVTETSLFSSFQSLVADPAQQLLGLTTSFDQIFTAVTDLLADTYRVTYKAQNETIDGLERTVEVQATCGTDSGSDTTTYVPGREPKITRTQETINLSATTQPAQTALMIAAQVTDQAEPFVQPGGVRLSYRPTSTDSNVAYKSVTMTSIGADTYSAAIPAAEVSEPGIDYYISATDGLSTVADPKTDASVRPYTIAVFPNDAPVLLAETITEAPQGESIAICAEAYDTTDHLTDVILYYRVRGQLTYYQRKLQPSDGDPCPSAGNPNVFEGQIPGVYVTEKGIEYFIEAIDNFGTRTSFGTADAPRVVEVAYAPISAVQLAMLAQAAYSGQIPLAGYEEVPVSSAPSCDVKGFCARVFKDFSGTNLVFAVAGTDDIEDTLGADPTFFEIAGVGVGAPTPTLRNYVSSAARMLATVAEEYPGVRITLTGHSLGGAIAQLLASKSTLRAVTFNSPGPSAALPYLSSELAVVPTFTPPLGGRDIVNYRVYGDLVSTFGTQLSPPLTIEPPIPQWEVNLAPYGVVKAMHVLSTVIERLDALENGQASLTDDLGPTIEKSLATGVLVKASGVQLGLYGWILPITNAVVVAGSWNFYDPEDLDLYRFAIDPGSPKIASVTFPLLIDVDASFALETFENGEWKRRGLFGELSTYEFGGEGVDQFRYFVIDAGTGLPPQAIAPFTFGVAFSADGTVNGQVTALSTKQSPVRLCTSLGNDSHKYLPDLDVFEFLGKKGEKVAIHIEAEPGGTYSGNDALVALSFKGKNIPWFLRLKKGELSMDLEATLPANGTYSIGVLEKIKRAAFKGDYCLTLKAQRETEISLVPTRWVE